MIENSADAVYVALRDRFIAKFWKSSVAWDGQTRSGIPTDTSRAGTIGKKFDRRQVPRQKEVRCATDETGNRVNRTSDGERTVSGNRVGRKSDNGRTSPGTASVGSPMADDGRVCEPPVRRKSGG